MPGSVPGARMLSSLNSYTALPPPPPPNLELQEEVSQSPGEEGEAWPWEISILTAKR